VPAGGIENPRGGKMDTLNERNLISALKNFKLLSRIKVNSTNICEF
jgi:hypothetical protein